MHSTKYRDLLALLIVLDEAESRAKALAEQIPELCTVVETTSRGYIRCGRPLRPGGDGRGYSGWPALRFPVPIPIDREERSRKPLV